MTPKPRIEWTETYEEDGAVIRVGVYHSGEEKEKEESKAVKDRAKAI
ncbi:MAG: hypothetical protein GF403_05460 [Candidatus Coatesbacteria bacterium]|nr:hypothetical protein [Candidatus Coatesbacteria bacterium]